MLAACGAAAPSTASPPAATASARSSASAAPSAPAKVLHISALALGNPPLMGYFADDVAFRLNMFKDAGLDVNLQHVGNPATVVQALVGGKVNFAKTTVLSLYEAAMKGQPVKIIQVEELKAPFQLMAQSGITSLDQLKGKTYGTGAIYGADYFFTDSLLRTVGLSIKDVKVVPLGTGPAKTDALLSGKVDAASVFFDQVALIASKSSTVHLLTKDIRNRPYFPMDAIGTSAEYLNGHVEEATRYVEGMLRTVRSLQSDEKFFAKAVNTIYPGKYKPEVIQKNFATLKEMSYWAVNGGINLAQLAGFEKYVAGLLPRGSAASPPAVSNLFVTQPLAAALKSLGLVSSKADQPDWYKS
ncbi:MAG: ABC transporter substrate-binding protein [Chloroflexota bacterium]